MTTMTPDVTDSTRAGAPVMTLRNVQKYFPIKEGALQRVVGHVRAVDGVSLDIHRGETVGLVGESGCGKTTLGRCISGLTDPTAGGIYFRLSTEDRARLDSLLDTPPEQLSAEDKAFIDRIDRAHRIDRMSPEQRRIYRRNCQVVFQDAFSSLNPR